MLWYKKICKKKKKQFLAQRDSNMNYVGCKSEPNKNQNLSLYYNKNNN